MELKKAKRQVSSIILHCTASPEGREVTVDEIRKEHRANGWSDIGYHYVIYLDGSIHEGRDVNIIGAHCKGHNTGSIGIAYVGGVSKFDVTDPKDTRTPEQKASLILLCNKLMKMYGLKPKDIHGHYEYSKKACPSFDVAKFREAL